MANTLSGFAFSPTSFSTKRIGILAQARRSLLACVVGGALVLGSIASFATTASAGTAVGHPSPSSAQMSALSASVLHRVNAIRATFGLSAGQSTTAYRAEVLRGLNSNTDPSFAPVLQGIVGEESLWGLLPGSPISAASALVLVNGWVYHDGWDGSVAKTWNVDCTSLTAPGCNGHRRNVLSTPPVPGAKLFIDVTTKVVNYAGSPSLAIAALMVWKTPAA